MSRSSILSSTRKSAVSPLQRLPVGIVTLGTGQNQLRFMQHLQAMLQDGAILLFQNVFTDMNYIIWRDAKNKTIVGSMM